MMHIHSLNRPQLNKIRNPKQGFGSLNEANDNSYNHALFQHNNNPFYRQKGITPYNFGLHPELTSKLPRRFK